MYLYLTIVLTAAVFISTYSTSLSKGGGENKKYIQVSDTMHFRDSIEIKQKTNTSKTKYADYIIDKYIEAIGGEDKLYNIIDRTTVMKGAVQGFNVSVVIYQKAPDKRKQITKVGESKQEIIFDGKRGISEIGGKVEEIKGTELEKLKYESTLALLPDIKYYGITLNLEGTEEIDSLETYKIVMTLPSGIQWTQYYDTGTYLKVKESKYIQTPAGLFDQETWYYDYRNVDGIKYPFKIVQKLGSQVMEFTVDSINVNTGLIDREFEIE